MSENNVLVAHFPRSAVGYSQGPVDEFVRQIGERLEEMQARVDELTVQNDRLAKHAATAVREQQETGGQREAALANAMLAIEQRRLAVESEIGAIKEQAEQEANVLRQSARRDAEGLRESARREAEGLKETARREMESIKETARREADEALALAHAEAAQIVGKAKIAAEEMVEEAVQTATAEEERLQTLCVHYDRTVDEIRRLLEMQLSMLPSPRGRDLAEYAAEAGTPAYANAEYDDGLAAAPPFGSEAVASAA